MEPGNRELGNVCARVVLVRAKVAWRRVRDLLIFASLAEKARVD